MTSEMPAMYKHCQNVYQAMLDAGDERLVQGKEQTVYEGNTTKLFADLGLSVPYYSNVMQELRRMKCIEQYRRGGGGSPSIWILFQEPTPILWNDTIGSRATTSPNSATQQQRRMLLDLNKRLAEMEGRVKQLETIMIDSNVA